MKKALLLAAGSLSVLLFACSKDDDNNEPEPDPTPQQITFMTNNTWKIDSMGYDTNADGMIDQSIALPACGLDNTLSFSADSSGVFSEGATKCVSSDPQDTPISWHFKDDSYQMINMDGLTTALDGDVEVLSLTDSTLVLAAPITSPVAGHLIVALED